MHLLTFRSMPDFITPSNPQKAVDFWLAARTFAAAALFLSLGLARGLGRMAHGLHPHAGGTAHS